MPVLHREQKFTILLYEQMKYLFSFPPCVNTFPTPIPTLAPNLLHVETWNFFEILQTA